MVSTITASDASAPPRPAQRETAAPQGQAAAPTAEYQAMAELNGYGEKLTADTSLALLSTQEKESDPLDELLKSLDVNDDGVVDAKDVSKNFLQSELDAAIKRQERTAMDSGMAHAATRDIDTNHDGVISVEEKKAVYG